MRNQLAILLASLLFIGCGVKKETHQKVLNTLAATQTLVDQTREERDELREDRAKRIDTRAKTDRETRERIAKLETSRQTLLEQLK
jgi:hypothetical protein